MIAARAVFQGRIAEGATAETLVHEFITHGSSVVVPDPGFAALREHVARVLQVSANRDVYMVGSAKLGFSIKPKKLYKLFGDESDVDLAVVSATVYDRLWSEARRYTREGGFWEGDSLNHFKNDHANGVIKAYVLPDSSSVPTRRMLFDLEADLQRSGASSVPVTIAVWHSMDALEEYQLIAVKRCQKEPLS